MLRARTRVSLALGAVLAALLALATLPQLSLADEPAPTPLPDAVSGPSVDILLALARGLDMNCETFTGILGDEYSCNKQPLKDVYYIVSFPVDNPLVLQVFVSGKLPWPEDHDQFIYDFASPFCDIASTVDILAFIPAGLLDRRCRRLGG